MGTSATSDPNNGDKVVYFGAININDDGRTVGSVDVWRSAITKELFCEEKRLGMLEIVDYIGMPRIDKDKRWALAVSRKQKGKDRWKLVKLIKEGKFTFADNSDKKIEVEVKDFKISDEEWWSLLVEENINRTLEVAMEENRLR